MLCNSRWERYPVPAPQNEGIPRDSDPILFGKYTGLTFLEVYNKFPSYCNRNAGAGGVAKPSAVAFREIATFACSDGSSGSNSCQAGGSERTGLRPVEHAAVPAGKTADGTVRPQPDELSDARPVWSPNGVAMVRPSFELVGGSTPVTPCYFWMLHRLRA